MVPRPVTARVIVMSFDLRLAVKGMAPPAGSGDNLTLSEHGLGGAL